MDPFLSLTVFCAAFAAITKLARILQSSFPQRSMRVNLRNSVNGAKEVLNDEEIAAVWSMRSPKGAQWLSRNSAMAYLYSKTARSTRLC
jgi:hypothetical protein